MTPDDAYRFAKGEKRRRRAWASRRGCPRPLDFLVVTDHAENLGLPVAIRDDSPELLATEFGKQIHPPAKKGTIEGMREAYMIWLEAMNARKDPLAEQTALAKTMWQQITEAADKHNVPGAFTALIGFEWTMAPEGRNMHRNVIFRDGKAKADQVVPISAYDSEDPQVFWDWLEAYEKKTGGKVLAIPHNGNISNGLMFDDVTYTGGSKPIDRATLSAACAGSPSTRSRRSRATVSPPLLSPEDEFADFDTWDNGSFGADPKTPDMLPEGVRARGLQARPRPTRRCFGANPFKFGLIGSTDSHTALSTAGEDNFFGKVSGVEPSRIRSASRRPSPGASRTIPRIGRPMRCPARRVLPRFGPGRTRGKGVWDALARRASATPRPARGCACAVFGGYGVRGGRPAAIRLRPARLRRAGVPMGGDLEGVRAGRQGRRHASSSRAAKDPDGANLDRVQVIKGWIRQRRAGARAHLRRGAGVSPASRAAGTSDGRWSASRSPSTVDVERARYLLQEHDWRAGSSQVVWT